MHDGRPYEGSPNEGAQYRYTENVAGILAGDAGVSRETLVLAGSEIRAAVIEAFDRERVNLLQNIEHILQGLQFAPPVIEKAVDMTRPLAVKVVRYHIERGTIARHGN